MDRDQSAARAFGVLSGTGEDERDDQNNDGNNDCDDGEGDSRGGESGGSLRPATTALSARRLSTMAAAAVMTRVPR